MKEPGDKADGISGGLDAMLARGVLLHLQSGYAGGEQAPFRFVIKRGAHREAVCLRGRRDARSIFNHNFLLSRLRRMLLNRLRILALGSLAMDLSHEAQRNYGQHAQTRKPDSPRASAFRRERTLRAQHPNSETCHSGKRRWAPIEKESALKSTNLKSKKHGFKWTH